MLDTYDTDKPTAEQQEAIRAAIIAFREANPTLNRNALAVAFITKHSSATSAELSLLLDLASNEYPSAVLSSSVKAERLVRDGTVWTLGPAAMPAPDVGKALEGMRFTEQAMVEPASAPPTQPAMLASSPQAASALEARGEPLQVPVFGALHPPVAQPQPACNPEHATLPPEPAKVSRCRFGLWSDKQVEIVRDGESMSLTLDEVEEFCSFLERIGRAG